MAGRNAALARVTRDRFARSVCYIFLSLSSSPRSRLSSPIFVTSRTAYIKVPPVLGGYCRKIWQRASPARRYSASRAFRGAVDRTGAGDRQGRTVRGTHGTRTLARGAVFNPRTVSFVAVVVVVVTRERSLSGSARRGRRSQDRSQRRDAHVETTRTRTT